MPVERSELLTTPEIALFVARGFLRLDGVVPAELNRRFIAEADEGGVPITKAGTPLDTAFEGSALRDVLDVPRVQGLIESLVGPGSLVDHHFLHIVPGGGRPAQHFHQDSTIDVRENFDAQLFYFPEATTRENGGTRFLPGSHLRLVNEASIARYQNIVGQKHVECEPGTVIVFHHGLWHGGGCNRTDTRRIMYKLRLNPTVPQVRLWNTDDLSEEMLAPQPIFANVMPDKNDVQQILCWPERWFELDTGRLEYINRIKLFRRLLGDESFDAHYWLTRLEMEPR